MDESTKGEILAAILDLRDHFEGRFATLKAGQDEMRADIEVLKRDVAGLKSDVAGLKDDVAGLKDDVAGLKSDVATLKSDVATLKGDVASLRSELADFKVEVRTELKVLSARLDEQRYTLNALIPTRIAAVPPAAE